MKAALERPASAFADRLLRSAARLLAAIFAIPLVASAAPVPRAFVGITASSTATTVGRVTLPGHTVAAARAVAIGGAPPPAAITVTLTLRRDDEDGFARYLRDVYDEHSPDFRRFLTQAQIAARFGPSQEAYDRIAAYLAAEHVGTVERSANRLTLSAGGALADVERAFGVRIVGHASAANAFFANDRDPTLPADIAAHVRAVSGLSSFAQPRTVNQTLPRGDFTCPNDVSPDDCNLYGPICELYSATRATGELLQAIGNGAEGFRDYAWALNSYAENLELYFDDCLHGTFAPIAPGLLPRPDAPATGAPWNTVNGAGQTIGVVAFDNYQTYDVANYLTYVGATTAQIGNLSTVCVGACASFGAGESEVLLDVDAAMAFAPGAKVIVYSGGFPGSGSSFQSVFNKMLSDGQVTIISNSWAYCEDQTSLADVESIDSILQSAAVGGISVYSGSGDTGSTCLDGAAGTIAVPADAPHITAVGGTTLLAGAGGVYKSETWWDGAAHTPPTGQGGFGVSRYFTRPSYQDGRTAATMRSVPDVSAPADPVNGLSICQTDAGGCPTGSLYGGTSLAAPVWAAFTALLNQAHGGSYGFVNPAFYAPSVANGFHSAASMGSDFAHVGLGSPNVNALSLLLSGQTPGPGDAAQSRVLPTASATSQYASVPGVAADGQSAAVVIVKLRDASGNSVPGKNVALAGNAGNHATISPASGISSVNDGTVQFTVTDQTVENVTFKATDTTDAVVVAEQPSMAFVTPGAAFASIAALPTTVASDGIATSTITVTLEDILHRPTPGKRVLLDQNHNSVIVGTNPVTTDANGKAQFTVVDQVQETVHYDAVDQTDGNLPVPNGVNVGFTGSSVVCAPGVAPLAGPGYRIEAYASGFPTQSNSTFGGITIFGCLGATGLAFDAAGNLFAGDFNGDVYKFPAGGGIASNANKLAMSVGQGLGGLTYGTDGNLYGVRFATTGDYSTGAVVKIDPTNGAATAVASNVVCPANIASNPLGGDLFVLDFCASPPAAATAGVLRVANPGGTPTLTTYATSEGSPNGSVSVAPDGTLYAVSSYPPYGQGSIDEISATSEPQPATVTPTGVYSTYSAAAFGSNPDGGARALVTSVFNTAGYAHSIAGYDMTATPPAFGGATLVEADIGAIKVFDGNGCLYLAQAGVVYKVSNEDGSCPLARLTANPSVVLTPEILLDNLAQGAPVTFDVTFPHTSLPAGTPVRYVVAGANHAEGLVQVSLSNRAQIVYAGQLEGIDTMVAYATIGGAPVASNPVVMTWHPNRHVSRIDLNGSVTSASFGSAATVSASIVDMSLPQPAPIPNLTIQFTLGGQTCSAITDSSGRASCAVTLSALTQCTLTAAFAGNATYLASTASVLFSVSKYDVLFANGFEAPLLGGGCVVY